MQKRMARSLLAGGMGAGAGLLVGGGTADVYEAIVVPAARASTATHPGVTQVGHLWQQYLHHHGYLPWRAAALLVHHPHSLLVPGGLGLGLGALLATKAWGASRSTWGGPPAAGRGQHGTAHWRAMADLSDGLYPWQPINKKGHQPPTAPKYAGSAEMWPRSGIVAGQAGDRAAWVANREDHVLLIGTTGAGKSRRVFLPTIGVLGHQQEYSFVVTDPKGELYAHSAEWLRRQGYKVVRFDLRQPRRGGAVARWNPLRPVQDALARQDYGTASQTAWQIAHGMTAKTTKVADEYWSSTAEAALAGLILAVAAGNPYAGQPDDEAAIQTVWDARARQHWDALPPHAKAETADGYAVAPWHWPDAAQANLISVYRALVYGGPGGLFLDLWLDMLPPGHPARDAWATIAASSGSDKTRASILSSALADLRLLSEPDLQWLLSAQGMPLDQPGRERTAVFLVVPDDDSTRYPLATLYLGQMIGALTRLADSQASGRLPVPVLFLLDEFGNFPPLPNLAQVVTAARSRGMRLLVGLQSFSQLEHAYGRDTAQTVRENLTLWLYLSTSSPGMAEDISKRLGTYTTRTESTNYPKVGFFSMAKTVGNTSQGESLTSRPLLTPDEIMRWPQDWSLVLQQRKPGAKLPLPDLSVWQQRGLFTELTRGASEAIPEGGPEAQIWWPLQQGLDPDASTEDDREGVRTMAEAEEDVLLLDALTAALFTDQDLAVIQ